MDEWEPEYQRLIRTPRPQRPDALLAVMGLLDPDRPWDDLDDVNDDWDDWEAPGGIGEIMLESLRREVGGEKALEALDAVPLPDEEFVWDGVADDVSGVVAEVLAWCDRCCNDLLDVEYRTACRRFLARVGVTTSHDLHEGGRHPIRVLLRVLGPRTRQT